MLRTGQAVSIKIHVFCQDLKGYHSQFLQAMSLYSGEAVMQIERCREDCYDLVIYKLLENNFLQHFLDERKI